MPVPCYRKLIADKLREIKKQNGKAIKVEMD